MRVKVLYGCVSCVYCNDKTTPISIGILTARDMAMLNYSGCKVLIGNRLVNASRKCVKFVKELE